MSHCRALTRPTALTLRSSRPHQPILPFLYQTRSLRFAPEDETDDIPMETSLPQTDPWEYLYKAESKLDNSNKPKSTQLHGSGYKPIRFSDDGVATPITMREKEVFTHIFKDLLNRNPDKPIAERTYMATYSQRAFNKKGLKYTQPPEVLTDMLRDPNTISFGPVSGVEAYPESLRALAASAARKSMMPSAPMVKEDSPELIAAREELLATETDLETLKWLDDKCFTLLEKDTDLAVEMYPELLYTGLQMFAEDYDDLSTVHALFQRAKSLGADSYVLGCTTKVYNLVIKTQWQGMRDAQKIWELVEEMEVNGIEADSETKVAVQKVLRDIEAQKQGLYGEVGRWLLDDGQIDCQRRMRSSVEKWQWL